MKTTWTLLLLLLGPAFLPVRAQVIETIADHDTVQFDGFVIDSDANNPQAGFDRDTIHVQTVVRSFNPAAFAIPTSYSVVFRILNGQSQAHPLFEAGGTTNADYTYFIIVNPFSVPAQTPLARIHNASLRPAAPFDPRDTYRIEARVFKPGIAGAVAQAMIGPMAIYHFTSTTSGDARHNVILTTDSVTFSRPFAIESSPAQSWFEGEVAFTLRRYDNFAGSHLPQTPLPVRIQWTLRNTVTGALVPLQSNATNLTINAYAYDPPPPSDPIVPWVTQLTRTIRIEPANGQQLDSVGHTFELTATVSHVEFPVLGLYTAANSRTTAVTRLLHFNGTLLFGPIATRFTSVDNVPPVLSVAEGSHVNTRIGVNAQSGSVIGNPGWTYGDGSDLLARLRSDGTAEFSLGIVPLQPPADPIKIGNVRVLYQDPLLRPTGLTATLQVFLPTGLGYRLDTASHFLRPTLSFAGVVLGQNLLPEVSELSYAPGGGLLVADETKPLWIGASGITWNIVGGNFQVTGSGSAQHVRSDEYATLAALGPGLVQPSDAVKRSNDRFYEAVTGAGTKITVAADAECTARLSMDVTLGPGQFLAHFPWNTQIAWAGTGNVGVKDDLVQDDSSRISGLTVVGVGYARGCLGDDCPGGTMLATPSIVPDRNEMRITRDGGLAAQGPLFALSPNRVEWGFNPEANDFAHASFTFTEAGFHMPGHFLRGDQVRLDPDQRPGALLFTGVRASNPAALNSMERPDQPGQPNQVRYLQGLADYAGLNFRTPSDNAKQARSILAGTPTGTYGLKANSKYYVRFGGVSGIHDAVPGSFPASLTLAGYRFDFCNFGFNVLDSEMLKSLIAGRIRLPSPAGFDQNFEDLRFNCRGGLLDAELPKENPAHLMAYWNADIQPRAIEFVTPDICQPGASLLVLGVDAWGSHVAEPFGGRLGFLPDGNIASHADGWPGVDSRLSMPTIVHLSGPSNETYNVTPVTGAYYNDYRAATTEPVGWLNFAAKMDVPFFSDLQVHVQTGARREDDTSLIHLMGGWPSPDGGPNRGWVDGNEHFFNQANFDSANRGYPAGVALLNYRDALDDQYRVRARRTWAKIISFDYALRWFNASRTFRSFEPVEDEFFVLRTQSELKYLTPSHADLAMGAQFELLPHANLVNVFSFLGENTGLNDAITDAIGITDTAAIEEGLTAMDELLSSSMQKFFNRVFDLTLGKADAGNGAPLDQLYEQLHDRFVGEFDPGNPQLWLTTPNNFFTQTFQPKIRDALAGMAADMDKGILTTLAGHLQKFEGALQGINKLIAKDNGKRDKALKFVQKLLANYAAEHDWFNDSPIVEKLLEDGDGTLDRIAETLGRLHTVVSNIRLHMDHLGDLQNPGGIGIELKQLLTDAVPDLNVMAGTVAQGLQNFFNEIDYSVDSPFADYSAATVKTLMRERIMNEFLGSAVAADIQAVLRQRLYDNDAAAREAIDAVFQEINLIARTILKAVTSELSEDFAGFLETVGESMAAASIDGHAHIKGDSLALLRLDLKTKLKLTDALEFGAFVQIKELDSDGSAAACYPDHADVTEVTFGAQDVKLSWVGDGLELDANAKFTFGGASVKLLNIGGGFEIKGKLPVGNVEMKRLAGALSAGVGESFVSGAAELRVQGWELAGGAFFGKSCKLDPIELWDPDVAPVLGEPPFFGAYNYAEGWVPINELIGIPSSCLLRLAGGAGFGTGIFADGPRFVAKLKYGVSGDFLCLLSIKGELIGVASLEVFNPLDNVLAGDAQGLIKEALDSLTIRGIGRLTGKLGYCPICLKFTKQASIMFQDGKWKFN